MEPQLRVDVFAGVQHALPVAEFCGALAGLLAEDARRAARSFARGMAGAWALPVAKANAGGRTVRVEEELHSCSLEECAET